MPEVWRDCCHGRMEMFWDWPAVLAVVLFSQAGFYIFRPDRLASESMHSDPGNARCLQDI
jgi:hypothetical protein